MRAAFIHARLTSRSRSGRSILAPHRCGILVGAPPVRTVRQGRTSVCAHTSADSRISSVATRSGRRAQARLRRPPRPSRSMTAAILPTPCEWIIQNVNCLNDSARTRHELEQVGRPTLFRSRTSPHTDSILPLLRTTRPPPSDVPGHRPLPCSPALVTRPPEHTPEPAVHMHHQPESATEWVHGLGGQGWIRTLRFERASARGYRVRDVAYGRVMWGARFA